MILREHAHLFVAAASHAGMSGKNNEDCYTVIAHQVSESDPTPSVFAIVADGVGGHRAGEVAAEIAVDVISHTVSESDASDPLQILENAIIQASHAIHEQSRSDDAQDGMGSTVACAWVLGQRLYTASVGDSRIYLIRDGKIHQLTTDHTWVQEAIEHGIITPDQARGHPRAHVIRRYLGAKSAPEVDLRLRWRDEENPEQERSNQGASLLPDDLLVLCSDGLTDLVDDQEIATLLLSEEQEEALADLIALANKRGGHDNITVVV
ncbi:MAG: serine/threonine-protein phosphatase, partial [Anaerolineales bacterium]|nr:serine/threonine-protein phosphatase [Anaerolineales bacterium]